jgi:hypothetical protein
MAMVLTSLTQLLSIPARDASADCHTQTADLFSIMAPLVQSQGTAQGVFFDPETLASGNISSILTGSRAFKEALGLYVELTRWSPPANVTDKCDTPSKMVELFRQGRCAFMYGYDVFKVSRQACMQFREHCQHVEAWAPSWDVANCHGMRLMPSADHGASDPPAAAPERLGHPWQGGRGGAAWQRAGAEPAL